MIVNALFVLFVLATIVQLGFWIFVFSRLAFYREGLTAEEKLMNQPVSIIICARNEAKNLKENLPHFLNQDYRFFEILVVNDNSSDETETVLLSFQRKYPNLRSVHIRNSTPPGKKAALERGIKAARYELLLLTDADCQPSSRHWVSMMHQKATTEKTIVLGYSPYSSDNSFLNQFIRFETVYTATQYFSFALAGWPYMGVGRNMMYSRSLFIQAGGFSTHQHIISGDDDLFINQIARKKNTNILIHPTTFVYSTPKRSWRGYYHQKSRHLTTSNAYRLVHKLLLGMLALSHFGHYALLLVLLFTGNFWFEIIIFYVVRIGVVSGLYWYIFNKLHEQSLFKLSPVLDAVYVLFYIIFTPSLLNGKRKKWK